MSGGLRSPAHNTLRRAIAILCAAASLVGLALWMVHTPAQASYFYVGPGAAYDTGRMVSVSGQHHPVNGHLFMLTVNTQPASLFWRLYARLDPRAELQPRKEFLGGYKDYSEYLKDSAAMMEDSQLTATVVAEQAAGLPARIEPQGAEIRGVVEDAPASGILKRGDVVVRVGSTPVYTADDLRRVLLQYRPGDKVTLTVRRGASTMEASVVPRAASDDARRPELGVYVDDARPKFEIPVPVKITSGEITGPSAGLMFCLQIISQVEDRDLTHGLVVAGTGTISAGGRVGPIGAVVQKVYTAEAAGAQVMFVPRENYAEAAPRATHLRLVPVDTLQDALNWLKSYGSAH